MKHHKKTAYIDLGVICNNCLQDYDITFKVKEAIKMLKSIKPHEAIRFNNFCPHCGERAPDIDHKKAQNLLKNLKIEVDLDKLK